MAVALVSLRHPSALRWRRNARIEATDNDAAAWQSAVVPAVAVARRAESATARKQYRDFALPAATS